jgi:hypothetical protein
MGLALDLNADLLGVNAFVRCDRSESQDNSAAECNRDQLNRADGSALIIIAAFYVQGPRADAHFSLAAGDCTCTMSLIQPAPLPNRPWLRPASPRHDLHRTG